MRNISETLQNIAASFRSPTDEQLQMMPRLSIVRALRTRGDCATETEIAIDTGKSLEENSTYIDFLVDEGLVEQTTGLSYGKEVNVVNVFCITEKGNQPHKPSETPQS